MALTDTAEYWNDIKNNYPYRGRQFTHAKGYNCSHINVGSGNIRTSEWLNDVNCFECLKAIEENGNIYGLKEGISPKQQSAIDKEKHRFRYGKCDKCGSPLQPRKNKSNGQWFLGCSNYPKCRNTKKYVSVGKNI